jgi:beta propeller repeat protein
MKLLLSLLLTISITVSYPVVVSGIPVSQITSNSYEDTLPQIKGNYLVWQRYVDGDWEIFLYNTVINQTTQITNNAYDDLSPQTDGTYVVWHGFNDGEWDIFLWDGIQTYLISDRGADDISPQVVNGLIVWTSEPFGDNFVDPAEIILYNAQNQTRTVLSEDVDPGNTLEDSAPRINDEVVVWIQSDGQDATTLYMYDLSSGTTTQDSDYIWRESPQGDTNLSLLTRHDGNDREIFFYDAASRTYDQITDNSLQDKYPSRSENYIAWMAGEGEAAEIYLALYGEGEIYTDIGTEVTGTDTATGGDSGGDSGSDSGSDGSCFISTAAAQ